MSKPSLHKLLDRSATPTQLKRCEAAFTVEADSLWFASETACCAQLCAAPREPLENWQRDLGRAR